jgi:pimeloyl-ACP methyl ester carboxylesterase
MAEVSGYIDIGKERLHHLKWGSGKKLLLAFHGYNNEAGIFSMFSAYLGREYTILSFDLPHHGSSKWTKDQLLTRDDLVTLVNTARDEYNVTKVSLLGYSLGGRICLTIIELLPAVIEKALLIAPDGLVAQPFYYFLTHTYLGRKIFSNFLHAPKYLFYITDWLHKKRWTDAARHRFVTYYLGSEESRNFLLQVWPGLKDIVPNRKKLATSIRQYNIPITIYMGAHDHIIPPSYGYRFSKGLDSVQVRVLEKGHRVFDYDNAREIAQFLL